VPEKDAEEIIESNKTTPLLEKIEIPVGRKRSSEPMGRKQGGCDETWNIRIVTKKKSRQENTSKRFGKLLPGLGIVNSSQGWRTPRGTSEKGLGREGRKAWKARAAVRKEGKKRNSGKFRRVDFKVYILGRGVGEGAEAAE